VAEATDTSGVRHRAADVRFMQGMIGHHAQAVEMVGLVAARTTNEGLRRLALRIEVSQNDEMQMMRDWMHEMKQKHSSAYEDKMRAARNELSSIGYSAPFPPEFDFMERQ